MLGKGLRGLLGGTESGRADSGRLPRGTEDGKWLGDVPVSVLKRAAAASLTVGEGSRTVSSICVLVSMISKDLCSLNCINCTY